MSKIKTGVLGYGFSAKVFHIPFLNAHDEFELTAITQRTGDEAQLEHPQAIIYRDYELMLDDDQIDLIIITTPSHMHFEHAKMALNKGKHVLVEKPYTATYKEALALNALAKEQGKVITVYQNRRYDGDFLTLKDIVNRSNENTYELDVTWDRFKIVNDNTWKAAGLPASNQLYDLGTHLLDQMLCLFGKPITLNGQVRKLREGTKIVDYFYINLNYEHTVVRLKSTMTAVKPDERYKMHTTKGTYYFHEMGEQEHQLIAGMTPDNPDYGDNASYDFYSIDGNKTSRQVVKGNYLNYYSKLADAINNNDELPVSHEDAALLIKYIEDIMTTEM